MCLGVVARGGAAISQMRVRLAEAGIWRSEGVGTL
jgi:hypothetical protein